VIDHLRSRLTYANVVATLALFLVLGGGSALAASRLAKNSVGTKQIKNGAITGSKLADGSVTGAKIALASLGTVPSAGHAASADQATSAGHATNADHAGSADSATTLGGLSAAQIEAAAQATCPVGTASVPGGCIETTSRPAAEYNVALETCARAGATLPTLPQLASFQIAHLTTSPGPEWGGQTYFDGSEIVAGAMEADAPSGILPVGAFPVSQPLPYRCDLPAS
jgi:hypothetical protein